MSQFVQINSSAMDPREIVSIELEPTVQKSKELTPPNTPPQPLTPQTPTEENGFILLQNSSPRKTLPGTTTTTTMATIATITATPKTPTTTTPTTKTTPTPTTETASTTTSFTPPKTPPATNVKSIITINQKNPVIGLMTADEMIEPAAGTSYSSTARKLFHEAAAVHGGNDTTNFLQAELGATATNQLPTPPRVRTASSTLDASVSRYPSTSGKHEKKIGHRRVDEGGEVTYKRIQSKQIMGSIQLGIQHTVGSLASKPKRDLLMNDFWEMETISFPADGSSITPAHHYNDFRFKVYAPIAFRYFRDLFGIAPDDFLMSMCAAPLVQLSNPGASGSIFYLTNDDEFIIKTVQKKECEFLQKLLPGYYMNLSQNPRTLLPKFFGLYCFHYNAKNVRLVAMNNLLPSEIKMHAKYDLKGSTFRRKASKAERQKASPTYKDLDFMEHHPNGIFLETDKYNALMKTIQRDCMVLESFQIMDYSLLVGIHNLDLAQKEKREERIRNARAKLQRTEEEDETVGDADQTQISAYHAGGANATTTTATPIAPKLSTASTTSGTGATALNRTRSMNRPRLVAHSTAIESITADIDMPIEEDEDVPAGGIPARSENDERLILYIGIIDILQSYRLEKKLEHTFKSIIYNGDTVSVCRPSFYAQRFQNFMGKAVFKKTPTFPLKHSPSKRKTSNAMLRTPLRNAMPNQNLNLNQNISNIPTSVQLRTNITSSSTPPPAFDDISEEDITATSSTTGVGMSGSGSINYNRTSSNSRSWAPSAHRSVVSSNRSVISSNATDDYGDTTDDEMYSGGSFGGGGGGARSPPNYTRSPRLSRTNVQLTTIGCIEDGITKPNNRIVVAVKSAADANAEADAKIEPHINIDGVVDVVDDNIHNKQQNGEHYNVIATTKTTVIKAVQSQIYTSTLVVNDNMR